MLTLLCAVFGTAWGETYEKVTSSSNLTDGEYLIVYEEGNVAFDGALTTLDATNNTVGVTISNSKIELASGHGFTIDATKGTLMSASGYYIGVTSYNNGLSASKTTKYTNSFSISDANAVIKCSTTGGDMTLKFNNASNQLRFRYFKTGQKDIQLYKKVDAPEDPNAVAKPTFSPAAGEVAEGTDVTISAADGCTLSYTVNGVAQTSASKTATVTINEATTIVAIAVKGEYESDRCVYRERVGSYRWFLGVDICFRT